MGDILQFRNIKALREELNKLLEERPEMKEYQARIDDALEKAGPNPVNRQIALQQLAREKSEELSETLKRLKKHLLEYKEELEKKNKE